MRKFQSFIFMGNDNFTKRDCKDLHKRLDEGLSALSGLQQPSHAAPCPETDRDTKAAKQGIFDVVEDVAAALGVKIRVYGSAPGSTPHCGDPLPNDWSEDEPNETGIVQELWQENRRLKALVEGTSGVEKVTDPWTGEQIWIRKEA